MYCSGYSKTISAPFYNEDLIRKDYNDNQLTYMTTPTSELSTTETTPRPSLKLIAPVQISLLNYLDANILKRPLYLNMSSFLGNSVAITPGSSVALNFIKVLPKKYKDVTSPFLVSNMNAKGMVLSLNNQKTGTTKSFKNLFPGDGLLLQGCAKMTYNSMTRTTANLHPYFKFTITLNDKDKTQIIFKFEKGVDSRSKSITFSVNGASSSYGFSDSLLLNPHASDISWILQINKAGQFFFAINKITDKIDPR